jgi:hypothetical protein
MVIELSKWRLNGILMGLVNGGLIWLNDLMGY